MEKEGGLQNRGRLGRKRKVSRGRSPADSSSSSSSVDGRTKLSPTRELLDGKEAKEKSKRCFINPYHLGGILCALVVAALYFYSVAEDAHHGFPCQCFTSNGPLVSAISSRRLGLSGLHVQYADRALVEEQLAALPRCVKLQRLSVPFNDVSSFLHRLQKDASGVNCIVWLVEDAAVLHGVANSLKELLEDNSLRGEQILAKDSRALLVLLSKKAREELKEVFPHRVVHMLSTVTLFN